MPKETNSLNTPKTVKFSTPDKPMQPNSISKVRVIARVRPFLLHEIQANNNNNPISCVSVLSQDSDFSEEVAVHLKDQHSSRNECYKLDSFFGQEDNNVTKIFNREVRPLIPVIFQGCNATVFAYGATGSGKTYTMQGSDERPGLMPLAMSTVLTVSQNTGSTVEISYYEVYMDRCYDLLELKTKEIAVLDDRDGQIHLRGLSRVPVNSMSEFSEVFSRAIHRRKVAHTGLNDVSSRSHGVLVITVSTPYGECSHSVVTGKLNLIDLAGNEDNRRTCNEGIRLQESAKINQSLFALSNVIYALNNNMPRVPYRETKLTRILQDSLGGTSRALMVACLNPGEYQESVHTVSLAARSRHISNCLSTAQKQDTPMVKVDMKAKLRDWLESKGKTKSSQRMMGAFGSPFLSKTPCSVSSSRKTIMCQSSKRAKPIANKVCPKAKEGALSIPHLSSLDNGDQVDAWMEGLDFASMVLAEQEIEDFAKENVLESKADKPDNEHASYDQPDKEQKMEILNSSPINGRIKASENSPRKALSPIDFNINRNPIDDFSCKDQKSSGLFEAKTPKTPFVFPTESIKFQTTGTPLDKFNAHSNNLKSSLVQEYLDFLNSASREELLELKGIGLKRAEYICELRETSPLKSLDDLEKIGLSSKQVHNMFSRAATGIFN